MYELTPYLEATGISDPLTKVHGLQLSVTADPSLFCISYITMVVHVQPSNLNGCRFFPANASCSRVVYAWMVFYNLVFLAFIAVLLNIPHKGA